jgi:hypothetical protein
LPLPIYNATWYDNKALGYYNYVNGGRNSGNGVGGGGIRVGGAMCGAFFGGGDCYADPVIATSSILVACVQVGAVVVRVVEQICFICEGFVPSL